MKSRTQKNLLVMHQGALGDLVVTFPALLELKRRYGRIDIICQNKLGKLVSYLNIAEKSFPIESSWFTTLFTDEIDKRMHHLLQTYHFIVLFSFSEHLHKTITNFCGQTVYRISPRPKPGIRIHVRDHVRSSMVEHGLLPRFHRPIESTPILKPSGNPTDAAPDPLKVFIHPGSGSSLKNWRLENFEEVYEILESEGLKPEFVLGAAEQSLKKDLLSSKRTVHIVSDLVNLADLLKSGGGFIGNDSGVAHLASFLGLSTVAVFGPSDPVRWRPVGRAVETVQADLECSPCFETNRGNCKEAICLNRVSPQKVIKTFRKIYRH
ncbi:MAG: glycosyltransferase family 9 protein [Deltaproteobacteria bacterium]|nr:glycosyltransferase family 9 protein [Deltaproteobacteria bacterium]MBW1960213.1 glycosyltransferase family 9 protein [Deltaproteobacteria bacterium]MBW1995371.1 glycosyltransferase family 9 protein [Deltaproteobacteria bacterium]MBW2150616.1 glycosyltransferase family 9 protein [Deltaproteobacteria bacterium]